MVHYNLFLINVPITMSFPAVMSRNNRYQIPMTMIMIGASTCRTWWVLAINGLRQLNLTRRRRRIYRFALSKRWSTSKNSEHAVLISPPRIRRLEYSRQLEELRHICMLIRDLTTNTESQSIFKMSNSFSDFSNLIGIGQQHSRSESSLAEEFCCLKETSNAV